MKFEDFLPGETKKSLQRGILVIIVMIAALFVGSLLLLLLGLLREASALNQFGFWGSAAVIGVAIVIGWVTWHMAGKSKIPLNNQSEYASTRIVIIPPPIVPTHEKKSNERSPVIPPPIREEAKSVSIVETSILKAEFGKLLESERFDQAEHVLREIQSKGEAMWCEQASRQLQYKRRRA